MRWYKVLAIVLGVSGAAIFIILYLMLATQGIQLAPYVAVIKLEGTISYGKSLLTPTVITPDEVKDLIDKVINDPLARAVLIVINSPGGSASASEEIYSMILKLSKSKPVIVYCEGVMASGGYYIALPAKTIVASPQCITGSIGAIAVTYDLSGLLNKLGINVTVIKSGKFKDVGSPFRKVTKKDIEILRDMVNKTASIFIERVLTHRPNVSREVFSARIYMAEEALRYGLIDVVGDLDKAIEIARKEGNLPPTAPVREITKPRSLLEILLGGLSSSSKPYVPPLRPGIYYLWIGGIQPYLNGYLMINTLSVEMQEPSYP